MNEYSFFCCNLKPVYKQRLNAKKFSRIFKQNNYKHWNKTKKHNASVKQQNQHKIIKKYNILFRISYNFNYIIILIQTKIIKPVYSTKMFKNNEILQPNLIFKNFKY